MRALANNSVTDSLEASFEASGARPSLFGAIRLYTTERLYTLSVVAIRLPVCYNRIAKILKNKIALRGERNGSSPSLAQTPTTSVWSWTWIELVCKVLIYHTSKTPHSHMLWCWFSGSLRFCSHEREIMNEWRRAICAQQHKLTLLNHVVKSIVCCKRSVYEHNFGDLRTASVSDHTWLFALPLSFTFFGSHKPVHSQRVCWHISACVQALHSQQ